jgi:hypothetical protein
VDDIVAIEVRLQSGENRYFLTWGRIQDHVEPEPLAALLLRHAGRFSLDGIPVSARVLWSLHPATAAPYFYEYFFEICRERIPSGRRHEKWRRAKAEAMERGREIWYLGHYRVRDQPDEPDASLDPDDYVREFGRDQGGRIVSGRLPEQW